MGFNLNGLKENAFCPICEEGVFYSIPANYDGLRAVSYTHLTLPTICSV